MGKRGRAPIKERQNTSAGENDMVKEKRSFFIKLNILLLLYQNDYFARVALGSVSLPAKIMSI